MKKLNLFYVIIILIPIFSGYADDDYKYKNNKIEKYYTPCEKDSNDCTYVLLKYDEFVEGGKKEAINNYILSYLIDSIYSYSDAGTNKNIDGMINLFFSDYRDILNETAGTDYPAMPWALDINGEVLDMSDFCISYVIHNYNFTGGAHPNGYTRYLNFNPSSGKILDLDDIFKGGYEKKLNKLLEQKFRKEFDLSPEAPLTEMLFENKIEHNNNFAISDNSIIFLYNRYEIAPYVFGEITLEVPYEEINNILKEPFKKQ
ncbi:MAG: DUF3298 domain-containing protein [Ignavibacteria bacterium]|nr:DUF3298 domain-containing protein [Ignavibacteria bacterium]